MKILVTGGDGFLGRPLVKRLREQGHEVRTVSRSSITQRCQKNSKEDLFASYDNLDQHYIIDLSRETLVRRMFAHWQPEIIIHLAANPNGKPDPVAPTAILDDNIKATQNLLHWCNEGIKFIFASSIVVYGSNNQDWEPIENSGTKPTSLYGITKVASEHIIKAYSVYRNINYQILRICAIVGPGLTHGILYDFIRKAKQDDALTMLGDFPGSCKPYMHVDDVVEAFLYSLTLEVNSIFNICSREPITVDTIANIVLEELNIQKEKVWLGAEANWKGDNLYLSANNDKAELFGFFFKDDSISAVRRAVRENNV